MFIRWGENAKESLLATKCADIVELGQKHDSLNMDKEENAVAGITEHLIEIILENKKAKK